MVDLESRSVLVVAGFLFRFFLKEYKGNKLKVADRQHRIKAVKKYESSFNMC